LGHFVQCRSRDGVFYREFSKGTHRDSSNCAIGIYSARISAPGFDDFKVYDSDKLLSDKDFTRKGSFDSKPDESFDEKSITTLDQKTNEQAIELPHIELDSDSQFYEQLENNVFKNLQAEPPYSVPQIDEKVRSLRVKRYLPPSNKGQYNENFEAEGIVGRK
jgi:hypothetical protein